MGTIFEIIHKNPDGSEIELVLGELPIKHYIGIIQFSATDSLANAKFENMEQYGWSGLVKPNYQAMESALRSEIAKNLGAAGKAKCIVLYSHGGEAEATHTINKIKTEITSSYFHTNHSPKIEFSGLHLYFQTRLKKIPEERIANLEVYNEQKKIFEEEAKNLEAKHAELDKKKIKRSSDELRAERRAESVADAKVLQLKKDYDENEKALQREEENIREDWDGVQVQKDIKSLGNIIKMIENGGSLVFASCYSGHGLGYDKKATNPFLTEMNKYYKPSINLFGAALEATFTSEENSKGFFDGKEIIGKDGGMLIVKKKGLNCAVKVDPSGTVSKHTNIKVVKANIDII